MQDDAQTQAERYEHSGRYSRLRTYLWAAIALVLADAVAWLYALGVVRIASIFVCALLPLLFGSLLGVIIWANLRLGKVRSSKMAMSLTFSVLATAYYWHWAAWLAEFAQKSGTDIMALDVALQPDALWSTLVEANAAGPWSIFGIHFKGTWLTALWLIEALIILLPGLATLAGFDDIPFCELCDCWCLKERNIARFWSPDAEMVHRALREKDFPALAGFGDVPLGRRIGQWYECDLEMCPSCNSLITLDVFAVTAARNSKDEVSRDAVQIVSNLLLTTEEAGVLRNRHKTGKAELVPSPPSEPTVPSEPDFRVAPTPEPAQPTVRIRR